MIFVILFLFYFHFISRFVWFAVVAGKYIKKSETCSYVINVICINEQIVRVLDYLNILFMRFRLNVFARWKKKLIINERYLQKILYENHNF